ncbi:CrcB protein [Nocardia transvalensis]|uniref:Fluoride-specific ion channel FluC n=1 Tax=Nocardia transvalensis TaxID=37333 RepID=A0A7W9PIG2_9NOCA|nr:fluoride efflux transporter CrcB [Nocardia transvalensis]MBB5916303.1 CrcB protein [Nocardia transvalensis]
MTVILIFVGAMVGAPLRYLVDRTIQARHDTAYPWGTFLVNLGGCAVLGGLAAAAVSAPVFALVGTGFCGALTTYSTFSYETVRLAEERSYLYATLNVVVSVVAGLGAALLSFTAVAAITG